MLAEATNTVPSRDAILAALHQASAATGSDFSYLLNTATRESGLKSVAKSTSSSAAGLFQFVEQTWLGLVKAHGAQFGLGSYAGVIGKGCDGRFCVDNAADRSAILALRNNPQIAALMEGEYANATRTTLQGALGRNVCSGELYAAHFLGPEAACRLIKLNETDPSHSAASSFPQAAAANRSVFYHADGTPKSVRDVYNWALKAPSTALASVEHATTPAPTASHGTAMRQSDAFPPVSSGGLDDFASLSYLAQTPLALSADLIDLLGSSSELASGGTYR
ncbi:MAG TPA: hypothetical protein VGF97_12925 [Rhizomicrobium sp.]|jgi:hypothetical protein